MENRLIERLMQHFKDRTEDFDNYDPSKKDHNDNCNI